MLMMAEKGIRGGVCHSIHQYSKANNKYMKDFDVNNLYRWAVPHERPGSNFEQVKYTYEFN